MVKVTQAGCYFTSSVSMATEIYVHGVGGGGFWVLVCLGGFFSFLYLFEELKILKIICLFVYSTQAVTTNPVAVLTKKNTRKHIPYGK